MLILSGTIFCLISALLMATRYLTVAIYESGTLTWSRELFTGGFNYIGNPLLIASIISLVAGIILIIFGIYKEIKK